MSNPVVLRWLIAHQPAYLFVRTAKAFAKELDKLLPGQFEIEVLKHIVKGGLDYKKQVYKKIIK